MIKSKNKCRRIIVLDTSAFLAGYDAFSVSDEQVTAPKVLEEIQKNSMVKLRFEAAVEGGKVKVKVPSGEHSIAAKASASKVGDFHKLSEADIQLLALAMELKAHGYTPQIVTDDYSIQNVAKQLNIEFLALATFGIKHLLQWMRYCPACHKQYSSNCKHKQCLVCGTELKRKPKRQVGVS